MNYRGVRTINSCQDNRYNRGTPLWHVR
jgi:hypothetical protein